MGTRLLRNDSHRSIRQNNRVVRLTKTVQSNFRATRNITTSFSIGLGARCEVRSIVPTEREKIKFWEDANDNRRRFRAIISSLLRTDDSSDVFRKYRTGNDIYIRDLLQFRCRKLRPVLRAELLYTANLRARLRKVSIFAIVIDKRIICCYTYNQGQRLKRVRW